MRGIQCALFTPSELADLCPAPELFRRLALANQRGRKAEAAMLRRKIDAIPLPPPSTDPTLAHLPF